MIHAEEENYIETQLTSGIRYKNNFKKSVYFFTFPKMC